MATRDPDDLVAGRYRLVEADGGDGVVRVWQAHDVLLDRAVVAKEVTGRRQQGLDEARVLARFNRVLDVVEEPGRVWIITNLGETPPHAIGVARVTPARVPTQVTPAQVTPARVTPSPMTPSPMTPARGTPAQATPAEATPARATPDRPTPARITPARATPSRATRAGATPAEVTPASLPAPAGRSRRPRALIVATATLSLAAAGGGIAFAATHSTSGTPTAAPSRAAASTDATGTAGVTGTAGAAGQTGAPGQTGAGATTAGASPSPSGAAATTGTPAPVTLGTAGTAAFVVCGAGARQGVMMGTPTGRTVPAGYVWHHDAHGFGFDVPARWERSRNKNTYCFRDPAGGRGFTLTTLAGRVGDRVAYWRGLERTAQTELPGYRRVSLTADGWEYTWKPADGVLRHGRQVIVTPPGTTAYGIRWTSADARWTTDREVVQRAADTFDVDPSAAR